MQNGTFPPRQQSQQQKQQKAFMVLRRLRHFSVIDWIEFHFFPESFGSQCRRLSQIVERFSIKRGIPKPKSSQRLIRTKENILRSQRELEVKKWRSKRWENTVVLGYSFASDWSREWRKFSGPITEQSKQEPKQSRILLTLNGDCSSAQQNKTAAI